MQIDSRGNLNINIRTANGTGGIGVNAAPGDSTSFSSYMNGYSLGGYYNGTNIDMARNNFNSAALVTLSASAANTYNSSDQVNYNWRGVQVVLNLTTVTTCTVTIAIRGKDNASSQYYAILTSASITTAGVTNYTVYPGAATTANVSAPQPLPRTWGLSVVLTGGSCSVTGTAAASLIV
jgi:hypothetical protein